MADTDDVESRRGREGGPGAAEWDRHWRALASNRRFFGALASIVRRTVLRSAVAHYAERFLPRAGVLVETGCGTGQASGGIPRHARRLLGLDLSLPALRAARAGGAYRWVVAGDLRRLPIRDGAVAGIWNLGVMEHFLPADGRAILAEFRRVLRPGSPVLMFWPPEFGSSRLVLGPIERLARLLGRPHWTFFPAEVHRLRSRRHAHEELRAGGFEPVAVEFSARDAFLHVVAVGRRPPE